MKNFPLIFISFLLCVFLQNCSSVKVLDSWKNENASSAKNNNFLVVARTNNNQTRIAFENEIVNQMQQKGYKATASFAKFGNVSPEDKHSDETQKKLEKILENEGFDAVVVTVMKDYQEHTRIQTDGGYTAGSTFYGYPSYYGGFYGYYYNPLSYYSPGVYVPETTTTSTYKVYVLETTFYNLKETEGNQLLAVVTTEIDDPESATKAAKENVKKMVASLQ
jgi:hypothetical protein